jgi:hypothetical protein
MHLYACLFLFLSPAFVVVVVGLIADEAHFIQIDRFIF